MNRGSEGNLGRANDAHLTESAAPRSAQPHTPVKNRTCVTHRSPLKKNPPTWIDVEGGMPWRFQWKVRCRDGAIVGGRAPELCTHGLMDSRSSTFQRGIALLAPRMTGGIEKVRVCKMAGHDVSHEVSFPHRATFASDYP
jgi:hypothetical protein